MEIYLSTGAFIGKKNGRNPRLLSQFYGDFDCDGFELLIFPEFHGSLDRIAVEYSSLGIKIPVIHTDKAIGDLLCSPENGDFEKARELFYKSCETASALGAKKLVVHCWGYPLSDRHPELIYERVGELLKISKSFGLDALPENLVCSYKNPLLHLDRLASLYPGIGFTLDTRFAYFHRELEEACKSKLFTSNVRHIHINDTLCGPRDWEHLYPILQPGKGGIDWKTFFSTIKTSGYTGTISLESPSILENGVDMQTLNCGLEYIRNGLL